MCQKSSLSKDNILIWPKVIPRGEHKLMCLKASLGGEQINVDLE